MENNLFTSTAEHWGEPIDCRKLTLDGDYYFLSPEAALAMAEDITNWLADLLADSFWVRRCLDHKGVRREFVVPKLIEMLQTRNFVYYTEEAMALSPVVYNLKTYQSYLRRSYIHGSPELDFMVAQDYPRFWNGLFPEGKPDPEQLKQSILRIFRETGKKQIGGYYTADVSTVFSIYPYRNHPNLYHGTICISFSAFCLNSRLDEMAEYFAQFAEYLSRTYRKLNIQVALRPYHGSTTPYMHLFGAHSRTDGSHEDVNCMANEWYPTYYLQGVEWYNSLSPLTQQHLSHSAVSEVFQIKETAEGALTVKATKPISRFDIPDAVEMKKWLLPTLYPGMNDFRLRSLFYDSIAPKSMSTFPRCTWAILPVFEDEIYILPDYLVFRSKLAEEDELEE